MKPKVITPQDHFVPQLYHKTAQGMSTLKTSRCTIIEEDAEEQCIHVVSTFDRLSDSKNNLQTILIFTRK